MIGGLMRFQCVERICAACLLIALLQGCTTPGQSGAQPAAKVDADPDAAVRDFQIRALDAAVQTMSPGVERDYFAGMLASRSGNTNDSIRLLNGVIPAIRSSQPERAAHALEALGDSYTIAYRYRDAAQAYDDLEAHFAQNQPSDVADDAALARILVDAPAQTLEWEGAVRQKTLRNPIGLLETDISVNGVEVSWLLDTGANQSVVTRSVAERLGLTPLPGTAATGSGITGIKSPLRAAILPTLRIGGAVLHNVVVIILDDANLRVGSPSEAYQIQAILGYPVLKALGRIRFAHEGEFLAGEIAAEQTGGAPMFMRGLTPAIESLVDNERLLFTFDTGATSTDFSVRYYELFRGRASTWRTRTIQTGGAGGTVTRQMFVQPTVDLKVGDAVVSLTNVPIFSSRMNSGIDLLFGNLGQDFVDGFSSFTLDFPKMTFSMGPPLKPHSETP